MDHKEEGRRRGREAAKRAKAGNLQHEMEREFAANLALFPTLGKDFDFAAAVLDYDRRRVDSTPDTARFPELKGKGDEAIGEREGFIESSGFEPVHAAYLYSFAHYVWKYVNCHHVARYDLVSAPKQCTNVVFPFGAEGITCGDNRDDILYPYNESSIVNYRPAVPAADKDLGWLWGGVSSAVLLDEEPENIFPHTPHAFMPRECRANIHHMISWMEERRDFWGAGNQIWADDDLNCVAVEKANRRAGYRFAEVNGAVCITACSYLTAEMNAFKKSRLKEVAKRIGVAEDDCFDLLFSNACDARHRRLWELTNAEAARPGGATLWGTLEIVADTAVPFPDRICLAGEKIDPAREPNANWTLLQRADVVNGPYRRCLYRSVRSFSDPRPVTEEIPELYLGDGVEMQPEWEADVADGKCVAAAAANA